MLDWKWNHARGEQTYRLTIFGQGTINAMNNLRSVCATFLAIKTSSYTA
jgi:hypothetical protein